jgi:hypothetical protein
MEVSKPWRPDRNEEKPYVDGLYCFTDTTPEGRPGAAWVIQARDKAGVLYWYCFKDSSRDCEHATRATLASIKPAVEDDAA